MMLTHYRWNNLSNSLSNTGNLFDSALDDLFVKAFPVKQKSLNSVKVEELDDCFEISIIKILH